RQHETEVFAERHSRSASAARELSAPLAAWRESRAAVAASDFQSSSPTARIAASLFTSNAGVRNRCGDSRAVPNSRNFMYQRLGELREGGVEFAVAEDQDVHQFLGTSSLVSVRARPTTKSASRRPSSATVITSYVRPS